MLVIVPFGIPSRGISPGTDTCRPKCMEDIGVHQLLERESNIQAIAMGLHGFASQSGERVANSKTPIAQRTVEEDSSHRLAQGLGDLASE